MTVKTGKYLTFILEKEEYGIGILKVKEIIGMMPITTIPCTPEFVKGVINLRGKVIPIIDSDTSTVLIGIVVDAVSEVPNIREDEIEDTLKFGTKLNTEYILGMAKIQKGVKILFNIDQVLSSDEITMLKKVS